MASSVDPHLIGCALDGELCGYIEPLLSECLEDLIDRGVSRIDLDLETLSLGTAAGLKAFVEPRQRLNRTGGTLELHHATGVVQRVLDLAAISSNDPAKLRAGPGPLPQGR